MKELYDVIEQTEQFWLYDQNLYCSYGTSRYGSSFVIYKVLDILQNDENGNTILGNAILIRSNEQDKLTLIPKCKETILFHLFRT